VGTTVLIVDDHAGFRASARRLLQAEGFEVVGEAGDASGGVAEARRLRPEMVLLDVGLPDRDGFAVARELAAGSEPPKVVLVTGRDYEEMEPLIAQSPARGLVPKDRLSGEALEALLL
jgi:DNA-binding NarL/FixJ family response regulator